MSVGRRFDRRARRVRDPDPAQAVGQVRCERPRGFESPLRVGGDGSLDDSNEWLRKIRTQVSQPVTALLRVRQPHRLQRHAVERVSAGDEMEQQDAETVHVRLARGRPALEDFWCEIEDRAREIGRRPADVWVCIPDRTEIHQQDAASVLAHDVAGLDVAMEEAGLMHGGQRMTQLECDRAGFGRAESTALPHHDVERPAANEFHPDADAAVDPLGAVDRYHVPVTHAREQASLIADR